MKRIFAIVLSLILVISLCACGKGGNSSDITETDTSSVPEKPKMAQNCLTGEEIPLEEKNMRPVAVMINNISVAQPVQTGLNCFDIVYETLVEGGITRLMGVVKNVKDLPQIGSVRSARVPYLEFACGHDALYVHAGADNNYFTPLKESLGIKTFDINGGATSNYGFRQSNGLASEHTLYTKGEKLNEGFDNLGYKRTTERTEWIKFANEKQTFENSCTSVKVPFSTSYVSEFIYDSETGKYIRNSNGTVRKDYITGETFAFDNLFILPTEIVPYSDNYHMQVKLTSGKGYYISNGTYEEILWAKAGTTQPFTFTKADGSSFTANVGTSYIMVPKTSTNIEIKGTSSVE